MPALLLRLCLRGGALSRFLAAAALVGFAAVGFAADAFAQQNSNFQASATGSNAVSLSWNQPDNLNTHIFVIAYGGEVVLNGVTLGNAGTLSIGRNTGQSVYTQAVSGLVAYVPYRFTLLSRSYFFNGVSIEELDVALGTLVVTLFSPPETPLVSVGAGNGQLTLRLTRRGLAPVQSFFVRLVHVSAHTDHFFATWNTGVSRAATQSASFYIAPLFDIYSPSSGDAYTIIARANNAYGSAAQTITVNPLFGAPAAPQHFNAAPLAGAASLSWGLNWVYGGGGFINAYIASWSRHDASGSVTIDVDGNIANGASVLSSLVPANRQQSAANSGSAVVPMPGGAPVTVAIRAHSRSPHSPQSRLLGAPASVVVTPLAPIPYVPISFRASVAGDNAVSLFWSAAGQGPDPESYVVSYDGEVTLNGTKYGGSGVFTVLASAGQNGKYATVAGGLAGYVPYRFSLKAQRRNYFGDILESAAASAAVTPVSPPAAPALVSVVAGEGLISLRLAREGPAPVESFAVRIVNADYLSAWQRGVTTAATQSAGFFVTPLFDLYSPVFGDAYTVIFHANNARGASAAETITINPLFGAPAAPNTVIAAPLPGAASLRWHQNWNHGGGGFINAYVVSWSRHNASGSVTINVDGNIANDAGVLASLIPANRQLGVAGWRSAVVPMLGGAPVTVAIRAHSRSPYSSQNRRLGAPASVVITPFPATPTDIRTELVSRDNVRGEAVFRIHGGASPSRNYPPYYYRLRHFLGSLAEGRLVADHIVSLDTYAPNAPTVLVTVFNLAPNARHEFYGQACQVPNCVTRTGDLHVALNMPGRVPLPPQNFAVSPGDGAITLSWQPPSTENNPGEIFGYRILGGGLFLDFQNLNITSYVIRDLVDHVVGVYSLHAINANGLSPPAVLTAYPGNRAPGIPYADQGDKHLYDSTGQVVASAGVFAGIARASPAGFSTPVPTDYWEFEFSAAGDTWTVTASHLRAPVVRLTVYSGLQGGVLHTIRAIAVNLFGKTRGHPSSFTPPLYPGGNLPPPQAIRAVGREGNSAQVYIDTPPAGQSPLQYGYWAGAFEGASLVATATASGGASEFTLPNLPNGVNYRVEVATHLHGQIGLARATALADMPPAAAANFVAKNTSGNILSLSWDSAVSPIGLIRYELSQSGSPPFVIAGGGNVTSYVFANPGALPGDYRFFRLRAFNARGGGDFAEVRASFPNAPGPPRDFSGGYFERDAVFTLGWREPAGDEPVDGYFLSYNNRVSDVLVSIDAGARQHRLTLPFGYSYTLNFRAFNAGGAQNNITMTINMPPAKPVLTSLSWEFSSTNNAFFRARWEPSITPIPGSRAFWSFSGHNSGRYFSGGHAEERRFGLSFQNVEHIVRMQFRSAAGNGDPLTITLGRVPPANTPNRPVNFVGTFSNGSIAFSWLTPSTDPVATSWEMSYSGEALSIAGSPGYGITQSYILPSPLGWGKGLIFLRGVNSNGGGLDATLLINTPPPAPAYLDRSSSASQGFVSFDLHHLNNPLRTRSYSPILGYKLSYNGVTANFPADARNVFMSGFEPGTEYVVTLRAFNAHGDGQLAAIRTTPTPYPQSPTNFIVSVVSPGAASVSWDPLPLFGVNALEEYQIKFDGETRTFDRTVNSTIISGLRLGVAHSVTLRALYGNGAYSDFVVVPIVMPPAPPGNASGNQAAAGDFSAVATGPGYVTLSWTRPPSHHPLANYHLVFEGLRALYNTTQVDLPNAFFGPGTHLTGFDIDRLADGGKHTLSLRVSDNRGFFSPYVVATVAMPPARPASILVSPGVGAVTMSFDPFVSSSPIFQYEWLYRGGAYTVGGNINSLIVRPLENGLPHEFTLRAVNAFGAGAYIFIFANTPPSLPRGFSVFAGDESLTLSWLPPANHSGGDISDYIVYLNNAPTLTLNGQARAATLNGLQNYISVVAGVAAKNPVGVGARATIFAAPTDFPPLPAPSLAYFTTIGNNDLALFWSSAARLPNGQYPHLVYRYELEWGGGITVDGEAFGVRGVVTLSADNSDLFAVAGATLQGFTVRGLSGHVPYDFVVRGIATVDNVATSQHFIVGAPATIAATAVSPPYTPSVSVSAGDGRVTFYLKRRGPAPLERFVIQDDDASYFPQFSNPGITVFAANGATTEITAVMAPLKSWSHVFERAHNFRVRAINSRGNSAPDVIRKATIGLGPPAAPSSIFANPDFQKFTLVWRQDPATEGGGLKDYFFIGWSGGGASGSVVVDANNNVVSAGLGLADAGDIREPSFTRAWYTITVGGLVNNSFYTVSVRARTEDTPLFPFFRHLSPSAAFATVAPLNAPQAPRELSLAGFNQSVSLFWGPFTVGYDGFSPVLRYELETAGATLTLPAAMSVTSIIGLTNGITHSYTLRAFNAFGASPPISASVFLEYHPPTAPLSLSAQAGNTSLTLHWHTPANDADATITAYILRVNGSLSLTVGGAARSLTATTLVNGEYYTLALAAQNTAGIGATATIIGRPLTEPSAPVSLQAQDGDTVITLRWQAPYNGGETITAYIARYTGGGGGGTVTVASTLATLTNIANGAPATIGVFAANTVGEGPGSFVTATAATTPNAPLSLRAQDGDTVITLQWLAPYNGGATILGYIVEHTEGTLSVFGGANLSATLTALANGAPITASVFAYNRVDRGAASAPVTATAATIPDAPLSLQAQDGDTVITLQWQAPYNGGAAITAYIVEHTDGTLSVYSPRATLTGLANGAPITASVYAINRVDRGASSAPVTATAATTPSAPLSLRAQDGDTVITLQWLAPHNGGATIVGYIVEHTEGTLSVAGGANLSAALTALANGAPITASVYAVNRVGVGAASAPVTATAATTPSAPLSLRAQDGDTVITLQWLAPYNGGAAIVGYIVEHTEGTLSVAGGANLSAALTALANGAPITASVYAVNRVGVGAASAPVTATAATTPSAPLNLRAQDGDTVITLHWLPPPNNGGAAVTGYIVEHTEGTLSVAGGANLSAALTALANGAPITASVYAVNRVGVGAASAPVTATAATTPSAPLSLRAQDGDTVITLHWLPPPNNGGAAVTGYIVEHTKGTLSIAGGANLSATLTGLANGAPITASVYAVNRVARGAASAPVVATAATIPNAPLSLQAQDDDTVITLQWQAPYNGGAAIIAYIVEHTDGTLSVYVPRATLTALSNGAPITASVYAINRVARGAASAPITATAATTPSAPAAFFANEGSEVITLSWQYPVNDGGATVTLYLLQHSEGEQDVDVPTNHDNVVRFGLVNGVTVAFTLRAQNRKGLGLQTVIYAAPRGKPGKPPGLTAEEGAGLVLLRWNAAPANGRPVTLYHIAHNGITQTAAGLETTVTGLVNGVTTGFTLRGQNSVGIGLAATITAAPRSVPGEPAQLRAFRGNGVVTLYWNAPPQLNGATVTGYVAQYAGMAQTMGVAVYSVVVSNLQNGVTYSFSVFAQSDRGDGLAATASALPATTPNAPLSLRAQDGNGVVTLSWQAPYNGGEVITAYIARYVGGGGGGAVTVASTAATLTGVANGAPLTASVYAVNAVDRGAYSAPVVATAATAPNAPLSLQAQDGDTVITLQWQAPYNGGATILGYIVEHTRGTLSVVGGANLRATLTALTNGAPITASVFAYNRVDRGAASAPVVATAATTPNAPLSLSAQDGDTVITLQWQAPYNGGATILGYIVQHTRGTLSVVGGANLSATLTALTNGAPITASVFAFNRVDRGAASAPVVATAATAPSAPLSLQAQDDDRVITLQWQAPYNGGAAITAYIVEHTDGTLSVFAPRATLAGLANGAPITASVYAINRVRRGAASAPVTATAATTPSAPAGFFANEGSEVITLRWQYPVNDGGATVTLYLLQHSEGTLDTDVPTNRDNVVRFGLVNGVTVAFTLRAQNRKGLGLQTVIYAAPRGKPGKPPGLTAEEGAGLVLLRWNAAPANGRPVTLYHIAHNGITQTAAGLETTVTGLVNGVTTGFTLRGQNSVGIGLAATITATPRSVPGEPAQLRAFRGNGVVTLYWNAPPQLNGATVTGYVAQYAGMAQTMGVAVYSVVVSNLQNGVTYSFSVFAQSDRGDGLAATASALPATTPNAPLSLRAQDGNGVVTLSWQAPYNGGEVITAYIARYVGGGGGGAVTVASTAATLTGVANGAPLTASVYAVNAVGRGAYSAPVVATAATTPNAPLSLQAQDGDTVITLQWQAPYNGGATILGYIVEHTRGTLSVVGGANLRATLTALANGAPITASVFAYNRVDRGAASAPVVATAAATASAPTAFVAFEGDTVVTLRWGAPANDGGATVTSYLLQHSEGTVDADVLTNRDNVVRFGLVNGVTVAFTLRAINRKGASAPTIIYAAPRGKPGAPASVTATEGAGFVALQWSAAPPNGRPVTLYHIAHNGITQTAAGLAATVSALTSGETVAFVLRGQNSVGIGAAATIMATPRSVPGLPVGLSAARGDAAVTLAWGAPPPNGSTITGYVAQYNGQAQTLSGAGHVGATLTGLTNGVLYTIGVYAQSDRGNGATAQVTARPARVPYPPLSLTAADGDEVITLQWQAPNNGGEPILQYIVESNGAPTLTLTTTLATLTGLVNGAGLSLQVAARNVVGLGAAGAAVFATAAKTASAPTAFGANEGEGVVTLFWGYPANDGGATVSLYVMEHRDVGQDVVTVKTPHNNVVRFALQNGVTVAFTLWAQNRKGLSGATVLLAAPRGKPGAPTGITASEGASVVVLRWNAAAANGRPVTLYYVSYNNATLTTAGEAATVSNLVNGATVAFTLWAQNSVGIGASATAMAAARSVPSVPSSLQAQRGDGVVTLLWALPADLNGASVTGYVAEYAGESQTLGGNVYSVVVGNLQNGAVYAFSVYAQSDRGDGLPAVASARPARVPFAPLSLAAADGDGVVTLQWQAPNNGGEPITAYVARYAGAGGGAVTVASTVATLSGLTNGAPITASVYALNVVGAGGASPPTTATAARVANAPTSLRVNEGEGVITLLWDSPANGGAAITAYIAAHANETITASASANSVVFANLPSGETVAFSVIALNRKGRGAAAFITAAAHGKPGAPASLRATRGNGLVTLTWNAPTRLNGSQLYGYGVAYNGQTQSVGASATGYTATGLTNGTEYEFSVFAKSDYGDGATATASAKPATTPATPASLRAYFADSAITLQWALVLGADAGGESVTAYIIRYGANRTTTAAATASSAVFANLTNGETIAFSVYAANTVGESSAPATISEYPSTTPNAPTSLQAQDGNGVITLQWSAPANNGGAAITAYIVEHTDGALTTGAAAATLTGLTNGEAIAMTVYAANRAGVGAASAPATATAATTPAAPVSLLSAEGDAEVTLQWGAPANGGAAILGYTLQWLGQSAPTEEGAFVAGNLTNGETVRFTVFAFNRKGAGAVATVAAAGRGKPGAPANVTATEGAGFVVLQWSAAPPNGRPVTLYRIDYNGGGVATAGLSVVISSLTDGETVAFTLRAQNSVGIGLAATITATPRAAPGAPLNLRAQRGNAVVTLSWSMPGALNGATITGYVVDYGDAAQTLSGAGRVGVTLFGLLNGVLYNIGVYAQSDRGVGATASVMAKPATTPAAPVSLRAADGDGVVTLQWLAPNSGGEPILRYVVESAGAPTLTVATTLATLTGLTNGEPITAGVYAANVVGAGARSASVVATAASAPAAPTAFVAFEGDEVVTLYWGYPANDGGASVTAYLLEHQGLSVLTQHDNVTRFALENGVTVAFTLRAQNRKGFGEAAVFYAAPRGKPGAPRNLTANEGEMQIILRWDSAPANGREVTLYYIAYNGASITTANDAATISPLTNGIAVAFTLRAQNSVGIGEAATITATPRSVPGAPANLQAQRGNGVVTLLWGAPTALNGATVTGYVVEYAGLAHTLSAGNTGWTASALQNGTRYAFTVYAQSNLGNGLAAVRRATPATTPAAPFGVAAADGNGVVTLSWQTPNNGGEPITAFVAQYVGGGGGGAATVASTAAVLTGIANGAPITASVYAVNAVGAGAYSAPIVATAATTPNAPLGLRAGEGEGQVTLFWNAPNNGGATITAYIASHAGETKTVSGNSAVFAGLTNGETVVFAARAINRKGQSAPASLAAAARGKPSAPTGLLADEGEMQIVLRWSAAAANGAAVTLYRIAYNGQTQTAENLEATIGGLSNGVAVAFTLRGQNSVGIGAPATITATPRTVPGAPASLQAQRGNRAVTLSWGAPAQLNGAAVTGYVVEYAGAAQTLSGGGVTGWVASGLQNGLVYSFTVYAQSDQGAGLAAVASAKPATTPAAPTGLTANDGDTRITLRWRAPASGGEDILRYVAVYVVTGGGGAVTAASTLATLTGLINGEPVIASVYAVNAVGAGVGSSPVMATAARVPSFVLSLRAAEGDTVATLRWSAPQSDGGAAITAYYVVGGGQTLRARQTRATITGLRNGITATFAVRAVNRKGAGAARAVSLAGRGKPDAPANFVAQGADGYAALSWDAAAANGASVTAYLLAHNGATQTIVGLSTTVGGLVNGETTRFTLRAQNSVGIGAAAVAVAAPSGAPGAPASLRAQRGDSVVRLAWQAPTQLNGATITGYVVSASHSGGSQTLAATARTAVFGALQNGVDYTFVAYAQSNRGDGAQANAEGRPATMPGAPRDLTAKFGDGEITLQWRAPASNGGEALTAYIVEYNNRVTSFAAGVTVAKIDNLQNGVVFNFSVYAANIVGKGRDAAQVSEYPSGAPPAVLLLTAIFGDGQIALQWQPPPTNNGATITAYYVERLGQQPLKTETTMATVGGLQNGANYVFFVYGVNRAGEGAVAVIDEYPSAAPAAALNFVAMHEGGTRLTLQWEEPDDGGDDIDYYEAHYQGQTLVLRSNGLTINVAGRGEELAFTLYAYNRAGRGAAAMASEHATSPPSAPVGLQAQRGDRSATLSWQAPAQINGATISAYIVEYNGASHTAAANAVGATITGLQNGVDYVFAVYASSDNGNGATATANATPMSAPSVPQSLTATRGDAQTGLSWLAPSDNGGSAVAAYIVSWRKDSQQTTPAGQRRETTALAITISPLENGEVYWFSVRARNAGGLVGEATPQQRAKPARAPDAPQNFGYLRNDEASEVTLQWSAPNDGGEPLTAYILHFGSVGAASADISIRNLPPTQNSLVFAINPNLSYAASIYAANTAGQSPAAVLRMDGLPSVPQNLTAARGDRQVVLNWLAPAYDGGSKIAAYIVSWRKDSQQTTPAGQRRETNALAITISPLENGEVYWFSVRARNEATLTGAATPQRRAKPGRAPDAPQNFGYMRNDETSEVTLQWSAPNDGGEPLTAYILHFGSVGAASADISVRALPPTQHSLVLAIDLSLSYAASLYAANTVGQSDAAFLRVNPLNSLEEKAGEAHRAVLPAAAAALAGNWTRAIGRRLIGSGGQGGGGFSFAVPGANFGIGGGGAGANNTEQFAALLRKHGDALAGGDFAAANAINGASFAFAATDANGKPQWDVWGGGGYTDLERAGNPANWRGRNRSYYGGIDKSAVVKGKQARLGIMFSYDDMDIRMTLDGDAVGYRMHAAGAHPYFSWHFNENTRAYVAAGQGRGEARVTVENSGSVTQNLIIRHAAAGLRRNVRAWQDKAGGRVDLGIAADAGIVRADIQGGDGFNSSNLLLSFDAKRRVALAGGEFSQYGKAGFKYAKRPTSEAFGWEASFGGRYAFAAGWSLQSDFNLSHLRARDGSKDRQWGWSGMAELPAAANGGGWSFSLRPAYGATGAGGGIGANGDMAQGLWKQTTPTATASAPRAFSLRSELGYGILGKNALYTPYLGLVYDGSATLRAGIWWEQRRYANIHARANMEISRGEDSAAAAKIRLQANY